jgi:glutaredoxin
MLCAQVGDLLNEAGIPFRTIDVPERRAQDALVAQYDAIAFPIVLVDRAYIGGFTHVVRLHAQGRLRSIVADDEPEGPVLPTPRPRLPSGADLTSSASMKAAVATTARAGGSLADFAKLGEYFQRTKKS